MTPVLLLMMTLNAATGEPVHIEEVAMFSSVEECEDYRHKIGVQQTQDGVAKVYACAIPPKDE